MSRKLFAGRPKHEGQFQDFPLINLGGKSISNWIETLPVVDDLSDSSFESDILDNVSKRKADIAKKKNAIVSKIAKLGCIKNSLKALCNNAGEDIGGNEICENSYNFEGEFEVTRQSIDLETKKESIWSKIKNKTSDLYYKAGMYVGKAMFAAGNLSVENLMEKPEMKLGENLVEYEKRVQRIGMAKVVGLTVISVVAVNGFKEIFDNTSSNNHISSGGYIDHTMIDEALSSHADVVSVDAMPDFSFDAYNISPGEGFYDTMSQMGITDSVKQYEILQKVGPDLQNMNLAYPIEGGSWGISNPGQLPESALELIWGASKSL